MKVEIELRNSRPSDSPLGGGGFVDLSGAKNAPAETPAEAWLTPPPLSEATDPNAQSSRRWADWVKQRATAIRQRSGVKP